MNTSHSAAGRPRYLIRIVLLALFFGAIFLTFLATHSGSTGGTYPSEILGTWIRPSGTTTLTFRADGTAVGRGPKETGVDTYGWRVVGDVLTFERNDRGVRRFARRAIENLWPGNREDYRIVEVSGDSITLLDLETNSAFAMERGEDVDVETQE